MGGWESLEWSGRRGRVKGGDLMQGHYDHVNLYMYYRGRNKPKLPLVRRISDMLKTTCPPTCPLVRVIYLSMLSGHKFDAIDHQNSGHDSHRYSSKPISVVK